MGIGSSRGEGRAYKAAESAINSPLLETTMEGAKGVLMSIAGGSDLGLFEINEAASLVQEEAHPDANIIFGTVVDDSLGDEVRVTVIAAGFEGGAPPRRLTDPPTSSRTPGRHRVGDDDAAGAGQTEGAGRLGEGALGTRGLDDRRDDDHRRQDPAPRRRPEDDDDIDVPPFMRH